MVDFITDNEGNVLSKEELKKMEREDMFLLLQGYIKKITYLHEEDKEALFFLIDSLIRNFKDNEVQWKYESQAKKT